MKEKQEHMTPALLKTGIPLAISLAGFFISVMIRRTRRTMPPNTPENQENAPLQITNLQQESSSKSLDSTTLSSQEEQLEPTQSLDSSGIRQFRQIDIRPDLEQEIVSLKSQVGGLQHRGGELGEIFVNYCRILEHGSALKDLQNALEFEISRVDLLRSKVDVMEAENQRIEVILTEYARAKNELGSARLQIQSFRKKIKKLLRMMREGFHIFRRQAFVLKEREAEILSNREEMNKRMQEIEELDAEVMELRRMVDQLQQEKEELMEQLELRENSATPTLKMMAEDPNQQRNEYEELLTQLEQVQNDKAADIDELIYLRWINACLRYKLMRNLEQQESEKHELGQQSGAEFSGNEETNNGEDGYESKNLEGTEPEHTTFMDVETTRRTSKRKPMLFGKVRRWVKGKESQKKKMEKENQEKSSGRCSASEMASEDLGRQNSCSALKPCSSVETAP